MTGDCLKRTLILQDNLDDQIIEFDCSVETRIQPLKIDRSDPSGISETNTVLWLPINKGLGRMN